MSARAPTPTAAASSDADWYGLVVAALVLIIVLIVCYMCVQLFKARRPTALCQALESFQGWTQYRPACSAPWLAGRRGRCRGLTTGEMPSIEEDLPISWAPCCGSLGVPPSVYQ